MRIEYLYPLISTSIWGVSIVGAKIIGNFGYSAIEITFGRFFLAALFFIPVLLYGIKNSDNYIPSDKNSWLYIIGLAISGVAVNNSIFYFGLSLTSASTASILVSINPLMTMILSVLFLGEKFNVRKVLSVFLGFIGVLLIVGISDNQGASSFIGNLLVLSAATLWASSFIFSKKLSQQGLSSIAITGWSEIVGSIFLFPVVILTNSRSNFGLSAMNKEVIFWFFFLGIVSSFLAYIIHYKAIDIFGAGKIAPSTNIISFSGAISAWFLLGDKITFTTIIGLAFILSGVFIVHNNLKTI